MNKAVFLDKDGTLIPDIPYNIDPQKITLSDDCIEGLKLLIANGYLLIIISNQSGIARGYFTENELSAVINKVYELLQEHGIALTDFYYCPHYSDSADVKNCDCRKPMPGMLLQAAGQNQLDLMQCWMIGDILNDIEAGNRAGCKSILINNGNETEWTEGPYRTPAYTCETINKAALFIQNQVLVNVGLEQR